MPEPSGQYRYLIVRKPIGPNQPCFAHLHFRSFRLIQWFFLQTRRHLKNIPRWV